MGYSARGENIWSRSRRRWGIAYAAGFSFLVKREWTSPGKEKVEMKTHFDVNGERNSETTCSFKRLAYRSSADKAIYSAF